MKLSSVKIFFHYETEPDRICGLGAKCLRSIKHTATTSDSQNLLGFVDQSAFDIEIKAKLIWSCVSIKAQRLRECLYQYMICSKSGV